MEILHMISIPNASNEWQGFLAYEKSYFEKKASVIYRKTKHFHIEASH